MDGRSKIGKRNKRRDFAPTTPLQVPPIIVWPPKPLKLLAWLPHYILPWNALFMGFAAVIWFYLVPFDQWFGTWHDGSADGEARMEAR